MTKPKRRPVTLHLTSEINRRAVRGVAESYDHMAERAEAREER